MKIPNFGQLCRTRTSLVSKRRCKKQRKQRAQNAVTPKISANLVQFCIFTFLLYKDLESGRKTETVCLYPCKSTGTDPCRPVLQGLTILS